MGKTNVERQREYRERALRDPDGLLLTRLQVMLNHSASADLLRLCDKLPGTSKKEIVERAISSYARKMGADGDTE